MAALPIKESLKALLDRVKEGDNTIFTQIPLFAENHSDNANKIISLIHDRIRALGQSLISQVADTKIRYYYVLDAILKKHMPKFTKAFEDVVLPHFGDEMVRARSEPSMLKNLVVLLATWEGLLKMELLIECLKEFYTKAPSFVIDHNLRTSMSFSDQRQSQTLNDSTADQTSRGNC